MKKLLMVLFSSACISSYSQDVKVKLLLSPLCLIDDFSFPTFQPGIEIRLTKRLAFFSEFGIKYAKASYEYTDTSFIKSSGYKAKTEIRYYLKTRNNEKGTNERGLFIGINGFYIKDTFNDILYYYDRNNPEIEIPDCFAVKKNVWGTNLIFGWQQVFIKHIVIESYGGFGVRCRKIENFQNQFDTSVDELVHSIDPSYDVGTSITNSEVGTHFLLNFTAGFRLGYQF